MPKKTKTKGSDKANSLKEDQDVNADSKKSQSKQSRIKKPTKKKEVKTTPIYYRIYKAINTPTNEGSD